MTSALGQVPTQTLELPTLGAKVGPRATPAGQRKPSCRDDHLPYP
jgi:hypothetical protein